jgi:hypothetical protein
MRISMKTERRRRRSAKAHEAVSLYLESFREQAGLEAVALTTTDGLLIGGAGAQVDLEWMGALGAASTKPSLTWESRTLHVESLSVHAFDLCLISAGKKVKAKGLTEGLERILPLA